MVKFLPFQKVKARDIGFPLLFPPGSSLVAVMARNTICLSFDALKEQHSLDPFYQLRRSFMERLKQNLEALDEAIFMLEDRIGLSHTAQREVLKKNRLIFSRKAARARLAFSPPRKRLQHGSIRPSNMSNAY
jgi:hypothetical protein